MEASIDPSQFDLVVLGTGLTESIVAAAAAKAGKSVLQLDPSAQYGGSWACLRLGELAALLAPEGAEAAAAAGISGAGVWRQPLADLGADHQFCLDLAPKLAYGAGPLIELLLGSGAHHYLEFKLVQGSYVLDLGGGGGSGLLAVPSSRAQVFRDRRLSPPQKRAVMRFLKAAGEALEGRGPLKDEFGVQPVRALLDQQGLDAPLQQAVLHGVLLADRASGGAGAGAGGQLSAAEALERLRVYVQSAGRYGPDTGPFLTPMYGCGELPQAFCRAAAVAGAVQVLRCGVEALLLRDGGPCTGVRLATGQTIGCTQLAGNAAALRRWLPAPAGAAHGVATLRCCAVLDGPLVAGEQQTAVAVLRAAAEPGAPIVRALALSSSTAVCPPSRHLLYLWSEEPASSSGCSSGSSDGHRHAAADALLPVLSALADTRAVEQHSWSSGSGDGPEVAPNAAPSIDGAPAVLWAGFYAQPAASWEAPDGSGGARWPANVALCPGPDSSATFVSAVETAKRCYWQLFPPADAAADAFPLEPRAQRATQPQAGEGAAAGAGGVEDADSDDEVVAALQAAMQQVTAGLAAPAAQHEDEPAGSGGSSGGADGR